MNKKIENIADEYNYEPIIFYISESIDLDDFYNDVLLPTNIGCADRCVETKFNRLFYIENYDVQTMPVCAYWNVLNALEDGFSILQIVKSDGKYYVKIPG